MISMVLVYEWTEALLLLLFFHLSLFETTEICLGCTKMEISTREKSGNGKFLKLNNTPVYA